MHGADSVQLDQLVIALGSTCRQQRRTTRARGVLGSWRVRGRVRAIILRARPVRLAQVAAVTPAARELARGVQSKPRPVHAQRDRLCDERRLAPLGRCPAGDRVVLWQVQANVRAAERRQLRDTGTHRVGELGHRELDRGARVACGCGCEVHPVREQRIQTLADLAIAPLRIHLPASHGLQPGRALERHRLGEAAVEDKRRLVHLQGHRDPLASRNQILLARERSVEHADEQLHEHGCVAGSHGAQGALHDEYLAARDDAIEIHAQRVVEQHALDRRGVEQARQLVDRCIELGGGDAARVRELCGQLRREKIRDLLELRQCAHALAHRAPVAIALLADRQQARGVPQRRPAIVGEHGDDRVAQVAVRGGADVHIREQVLERRHDIVGDHIRGRVRAERIESARRAREVEQRTRALGWHQAHSRIRRIALWIEHDHRAALAAEILRDSRDQIAGLSLLDRPRHGRVLLAQRRMDRHRAKRVPQSPRAALRAQDRGWRRRYGHAAASKGNGGIVE